MGPTPVLRPLAPESLCTCTVLARQELAFAEGGNAGRPGETRSSRTPARWIHVASCHGGLQRFPVIFDPPRKGRLPGTSGPWETLSPRGGGRRLEEAAERRRGQVEDDAREDQERGGLLRQWLIVLGAMLEAHKNSRRRAKPRGPGNRALVGF
ncbi:hypothetical protein KM043_002558 [Ampulex compressa]|nr:hypothetical protein KM043_002558 [Ampulex compressa]